MWYRLALRRFGGARSAAPVLVAVPGREWDVVDVCFSLDQRLLLRYQDGLLVAGF